MNRVSPHHKQTMYSLLVSPQKDVSFDDDDITPSIRHTRQDRVQRALVFPVIATVIITLVAFCALRGPLSQQSKLWRPLLSSSKDPIFSENSGSDHEYLTSRKPETAELSDIAFQGILKQYRLAMRKTNHQIWLPLVLRYDNIMIAATHLADVKVHLRFQIFVAMVRKALKGMIDKSLGLPLLYEKLERRSIPFLMTLGDHKSCERTKFPRFGWCTTTDTMCTVFALPTFSVYREAPKSSSSSNVSWFHERLEQRYPWSDKKAQAVWRGSATGPSVSRWGDLPRAKLVNFSIQHPELLDAAFTHAKQFQKLQPEEEAKMREHSRFASFIRFPNFQRYRAVIDIDGNSWSNRFGRLLCMNSAVVKIQPANENYFYSQLQPWVHYIPVAANLSDLEDALEFATSNETQEQVRFIVRSANEFCRTHLTKESMARDIRLILSSYLELLGTNETRWRQWDEVMRDYAAKMELVEPAFVSFDDL